LSPVAATITRPDIRGALLTIALLTVAAGSVGATAALFNSATTNTGFIAAPALHAVTGFTGVAQDNTNVRLTWSAGSSEGNGYTILKDAGPPAYPDPCGAATYGTTLVTATTSLNLTDAQPASAALQGMFVCYKALRVYTPPGFGSVLWTSQNSGSQTNPTQDVQLGMVANQITFTNGGTGGGLIDDNDLIDIYFNQATNRPPVAGTVGVCLDHSTSIMWLETPRSTTRCQVPSAAGNVGSVTGMAVSFNPSNKDAVFTATWNWVDSTHLEARITGSTGGATATVTNSAGSYLPTTSLGITSTNSSSGGAAPICATVVVSCNPVVSGAF
jgi:hypothetical protein